MADQVKAGVLYRTGIRLLSRAPWTAEDFIRTLTGEMRFYDRVPGRYHLVADDRRIWDKERPA